MPAIRVCHILKSRDNAFGGLAVAVSSLCQSLQTLGVEAKIAPCIDDAPSENPEIKSVFFKTLGGIQQKLVFPFKIIWFLCRSRPEVIHSHGIWLFIHYVGHRVAKSTKRPHVISIHGMLSKWALSRSKIKKFLAWNLFQKRALSKAACLHATSDAEVEEIRSLGIRTPIVLAPNGVRIPPPIDHLAREVSETRPLRMALFLSRIQCNKGFTYTAKSMVYSSTHQLAACYRRPRL